MHLQREQPLCAVCRGGWWRNTRRHAADMFRRLSRLHRWTTVWTVLRMEFSNQMGCRYMHNMHWLHAHLMHYVHVLQKHPLHALSDIPEGR